MSRFTVFFSSLTLSSLSFWVSFLFKEGTEKSEERALHELQNVVEGIASSASEPSTLYETAVPLIFVIH